MAYASGLSGQIGTAAETYYGTPAVVTHFYEFLSESLVFTPTWLDGLGLKANQAFKRAARTQQSQFTVAGDIVMEHTIGSAATAVADSMGFWWKYALGSTVVTPTVVSGTAYKQIHTPGSKAGQFMTVQVGRPQVSGVTVQPHTYTGVKCTDWEFSCSDNQLAQLKVTLDGRNEYTLASLGAPTGLAAAAVGSGGTFAAATYFWKITGTNAQGESTGSAEASATIVLNGSCNLTWSALPATTTGVKVYRGTVTQTENVLVATLGAVVAYTDTGIAGTSGAPPASNALVGASYPTPNGLFSFANASTFTIGGTATTSAGETTVAGGTAIGSLVNSITIAHASPMKTTRYGLGNQGFKGEPVENAIPTITGTLSTEYFSRAELYDVFRLNTTTTLELDFTAFDAAGLDAAGVANGANPYRLAFILPAVKFKTGSVNISSPDVIPQSIGFEAFDDGSGSNPVIQVKLVSKESGAI